MNRSIRIFLPFFLLAVFAGRASAVETADYIQMSNQCKYYTQRLESQAATLNELLDFVNSADLEYCKEKANRLRSAVSRCQGRLDSGELDNCTVTYKGSEITMSQALEEAAKWDAKYSECSQYQSQIDLDRQAITRQLEVIKTLKSELDEWKKNCDGAVFDQLRTTGEFFFVQSVSWLTEQAKSVGALSGWITKYEKQLTQKGVNVALIKRNLLRTRLKYIKAQGCTLVGKALDKTEPATLITLLQAEGGKMYQLQAEADAEIKQALRDSGIEKVVQMDNPAWTVADVLTQKGLETVLKSKGLDKVLKLTTGTAGKLAPAVAITALLRDTTFNFTNWYLSLKQVTDRYEIIEKSEEAAESLERHIDNRRQTWDSCLKP